MTMKVTNILSIALAVSLLLASWMPAVGATGDPVLINEVFASHTGTDDTEFIELFGDPGSSLDGLSLIIVESDAFGPGTIDRQLDFGSNDILGSNGFYLVGNPIGLAANYGATPNIEIANNYLENSSLTVALVETASITDIVVTGSEIVLDAVALTDGDAGDVFFFDAPVVGPDGSFFPAGARRAADGVDTDASDDWLLSDFFLGSDNTPTAGDTPPPPPPPFYTIMEIQGAGHLSPLDGEEVKTYGIVTAVAFNGFYVQDPDGDDDVNTSDGIFVFSSENVSVGDEVELAGPVSEFIPGGAGTGNLSTTQLFRPDVSILTSGNDLPDPMIIGQAGRIPPNVDVISRDERPVNLQVDIQDPEEFNPDNDGIDFYESLEGMLATMEDTVAVAATRTFSPFSSELFVLANNGADIAPKDARTARGGINLQPDPDNDGDQNPERVQIQFDGTLYPFPVPVISVGDRLADVTGVVGYSFGNFEVNAVKEVIFYSSGLEPETTKLTSGKKSKKTVTVASYNVLNLSPLESDDSQRTAIAAQIVNNLGQPDVIALQEIQDNSGETDDGITDASQTLQALVDAIAAAGGPDYRFFDVAPADGTSGGVPGGNIRNAFLYNPSRVKLVDFESLTLDVLEEFGVGNPDAFFGTRNPLMATFKFKGKEFTVINNHLTSRFGSTPVFGGPQPFVQAGEAEREAQTRALNEVVGVLLSAGRGNKEHASKAGRVIVLGDLNTMEFTDDLTEILPGTGRDRILYNLINSLTDDNVYTFNFEGNAQVLDHVFATESLLKTAQLDIVHVNVDYPRVDGTVASDHEPLIVRFDPN
jgi:endonuclease/exonuclease/phosphatase family metal-dependent hydrolase